MRKPRRAAAVAATLAAVTLPGPNRLVSRLLWRLDTIVPKQMIMETIPARETGTPSSPYIDGQAAPRRESGRPRLMNAR